LVFELCEDGTALLTRWSSERLYGCVCHMCICVVL